DGADDAGGLEPLPLLEQQDGLLEQVADLVRLVADDGDLVAPDVDLDALERLLDEAEELVAMAEEVGHQVVAGNGDLDLGGCHGTSRLGRTAPSPAPDTASTFSPVDRAARPPDPPGPPGPDAGPSPLVGDGADRFARWAAEARVEEAARARAREGWLRRQAEESASLTGVVAGVGGRGAPVTVHARAGGRHAGVVRAAGADVVVLRAGPGPGGEVLVPLAAVTSLRVGPGDGPVVGDRPSDLAAERPTVRVVTVGGDAVAGELQAVGRDVLVVAPSGGGAAYVALGAVAEVAVGSPGPA